MNHFNEPLPAATWEIVADVWTEFVTEFQSEAVVCDQVMIITNDLLLRSPNLDLLAQMRQSCLIN